MWLISFSFLVEIPLGLPRVRLLQPFLFLFLYTLSLFRCDHSSGSSVCSPVSHSGCGKASMPDYRFNVLQQLVSNVS